MVQIGDFDASGVSLPGVLPEGEYVVSIANTALMPNRRGNGQHLWIEFVVQQPAQYFGRAVSVRLNLYHDNPMAVEMARAELAAICRAAGRIRIQDTQELHGRMLRVLVRHETTQQGRKVARPVEYLEYVGPGASVTQSPAPQQKSTPENAWRRNA
jgi:hypothetical protein